jgi:transposase InsO family protein
VRHASTANCLGIRDKPIAPASPWQNGFAERIIGSIRRECLDHIIVSGEAHLRRNLISYAAYYDSVRTHRSLHKDAPSFRPIQHIGIIRSKPDPRRASSSLRPGLSFWYTQVSNWVMLLVDERCLQPDLVGADRIVPVASVAASRELKLGIDVGQTTVAKYMARGRRPPSPGWKTFLDNHADGIASMDLFVVPTISFRLLYGLLILHHDRRQILWLGVTAHPTAEWISHQLTEACGWKVAPRYIVRDRDAVYGDVFIRRLRAMGIRDRPTAPRSPWQNGSCERAIGSIRRECLDHVVVFGERHLRHLLRSYASCYNAAGTHLSVNKDAPLPRTVHAVGRIVPTPFLGGLHHLYVRV